MDLELRVKSLFLSHVKWIATEAMEGWFQNLSSFQNRFPPIIAASRPSIKNVSIFFSYYFQNGKKKDWSGIEQYTCLSWVS